MTTDTLAIHGEYICGAYVEFGFDRCFDCPFDECTSAHASSVQCPRRQAELAQLRADGVIPPGYLVREELADRLNISTRNLRAVVRKHEIPSIMHRVGKLKWRLYPMDAVNNVLEVIDAGAR